MSLVLPFGNISRYISVAQLLVGNVSRYISIVQLLEGNVSQYVSVVLLLKITFHGTVCGSVFSVLFHGTCLWFSYL